MTKNDSVDVHS